MATNRQNNSGQPTGGTVSTGAGDPGSTVSAATPEMAGGQVLNQEEADEQAQAEQQRKEDNDAKQHGRKPASDETPVKESQFANKEPQGKLSVMQVVAHMATKPNVFEEYQDLLKRGKIANPKATEVELKRLGHFLG